MENLPNKSNASDLHNLSIYELRNLARSLGISKPTSVTRADLITRISEILSGKKWAGKIKETRGRKPRRGGFDLASLFFEEASYVPLLLEPELDFGVASTTDTLSCFHVAGFVHILKEGGVLLSTDLRVFKITPMLCSKYQLQMGDYIQADTAYSPERKEPVVSEIYTINGINSHAYKNDKVLEFIRPHREDRLGEHSIKLGSRILITSDKSHDRIKCMLSRPPEVANYRIALVIEEGEDAINHLLENGMTEAFLVKPDLNLKKQVALCLFALFKAKQQAESGHDVILYIDSLSKLYRIYSKVAAATYQLDLSKVSLAPLADIKSFFLSSKAIKDGGSLTIKGYLNKPTNNVEQYIYEEFCDLANQIIEN